jgi:16S rRNA G966 N2-methylase RsmD
VKAGNPKGSNQREIVKSHDVTLQNLGITKNESSLLQKIASIPEDKFEQILQEAEVETKKVTNNMLVSIAKEAEKENRKEKEKESRGKKISGIEIRKGDFKEVLSDVYDIDAIITDPPYPAEYLDCFSELSKYASEHLKNDGWLVVYSGQYNLPEVIKRLSEHMTYVWTFCLYHIGKKQLVNGVNIMCGWKPILIFSKGKKKMRFSVYDVIESEQREKHSHAWQQSESGVLRLIEAFTEPGQLVVDPFSGSGTFCKAAIENGRKAIGAEIG